MNPTLTPSGKPSLTPPQVEAQLRKDISAMVERWNHGENITAVQTVWQGKGIVSRMLSGLDLIQEMKTVADNIQWWNAQQRVIEEQRSSTERKLVMA